MSTALFVRQTPGRYSLIKGNCRNWLRDNKIPAMYSPVSRGWHVRNDRLADLLALAESDGLRVHVRQVAR